MSNMDLNNLREKLDEINLSVLELINERAKVVRQIGKVKEKQGVNPQNSIKSL